MSERRRNDELTEEFYTGYLSEAPAGIARHVRRTVWLALAVTVLAAVLVATAQRPFDVSFFEFGQPRSFEGVVETEPVPMLRVDRPGSGLASRYLLVAFGKHGAEEQVRGLHGRKVELEGTLIYRDGQTMIELVDGSVAELPGSAPSSGRSVALGEVTLRGEIVDSKCHFGVMKPGDHKPHRACASLCIRGGIPPVFVVRDGEGLPLRHLLLVGSDGRALNQEVLPYVAEPLEVRGKVERLDDLWILEAEPGDFRRLYDGDPSSYAPLR